MPPSYQTVPLAVPPKTLAIPPEEPAPTSVPTMKKLVVAAMVGTALVGGYSYGSSTNPAMINNVNGFAAGVSYSTNPVGCAPGAQPDAKVYSAPDVVTANIPELQPLSRAPATICLEACFTPSEVSDFNKEFEEWKEVGIKMQSGKCQEFGYSEYDNENTTVNLHDRTPGSPTYVIPIFKKPFVWYV